MNCRNSGHQWPMMSVLLVALLGLIGGCVSNQPKQEAQETAPIAAPVAAPVPETKPVCQKAIVTKKKTSKTKAQETDCVPAASTSSPAEPVAATQGGYDLSKNKPITDSAKVEAGQGTLVKGINDWQGEISGVPAPNSPFNKLRIGMSRQQVMDLVGPPTDQGAYVTGKAFIPFYFGSDRSRWEMVHKGLGRLIFSNQSGFGSGHYLTWIIHNANEGGYR